MIYCYASITRVVWLRTHGVQHTHDINKPLVHFVSCRKSQLMAPPVALAATAVHAASDPLVAIAAVQQDRPRCHTVPCNSTHLAVNVPRRLALTTKRSVIKMSMSIVVGFVVCWSPYFVINLIRTFSNYEYTLNTAYTISKLMAVSHSALNPLLYIMFSMRAVRAAFSSMCQRAHHALCCPSHRLRLHRRVNTDKPAAGDCERGYKALPQHECQRRFHGDACPAEADVNQLCAAAHACHRGTHSVVGHIRAPVCSGHLRSDSFGVHSAPP